MFAVVKKRLSGSLHALRIGGEKNMKTSGSLRRIMRIKLKASVWTMRILDEGVRSAFFAHV
jgi:hypothetical protein